MKCLFLFLAMLLMLSKINAQAPILFYDFENNTTRTTFENLVEQNINSGSSAITKVGTSTTITGVSGAGLSATYSGTANGMAAQASGWLTSGTDPGNAPASYYQVVVNTTNFSGINVVFDAFPSSSNGPNRINVTWSTDGTTFNALTAVTVSNASRNGWTNLLFSLPSGVDNQSAVTLRIYAFNATSSAGTLTMDNLEIDASNIISNASSSISLLNESSIYTSNTSGTTGSIWTRNNFTIGTNSTATLTSNFAIASSNTLTNNGTLNLSTFNVSSGGAVSLGSSSTLNFASTGGLTNTGGLTIAANAVINNTSASASTFGNNAQSWNGDFSYTGSQSLNIGTGAVTLGANRQVSVSNSNILTVGGIISGAFSLTKAGTGTLSLTAASNAYTGGTTVTGGLVTAAGEGRLGANPGSFNATYITLNGGGIGNTLGNNISFSSNRGITLGSSGGTFDATSGQSITALNVITGTGSLTKTSAGTLLMTGAHTYTGNTILNAGVLQIGVAPVGSVGSITSSGIGRGSLTINGGTISSDGTTARTILNATTIAADVVLGNTTNNGALTFGAGTTISGATRIINNPSTVNFNGVISDGGNAFGLTKIGAGTLVIGAANTYTGTTKDSVGTIQLSAANLFQNTGALTISSGASFDMKGFSDTLGSIAGAGSITSSAAGTIVLTNGGDNTSTTFSGIISNGTATSLAITKTGSGTLTLTGSNTYTGLTTISSGTLQLNKSGGTTLPITDSCTVTGGTLQISTNQTLKGLTLASGTTLTVDAGVTLTITGTLTVNTATTINGTGTIAYSSGVLVYNGSTSKTAGIEWPTSNVPTSVGIGATATIVLGATRTTTATLTVDGVLDASTYSITGTGTVNINGKLITSNLNGLTGTGATFTGATPVLGATSTIEYAASSGTQVISTSPAYARLTLSSGGTKTAVSTLNISDSLTISGTTIFNASNSSIGGSGTKLTMTGTSRYILAGTGTKPDATGTYNLGSGTTIEFTNIAATLQTIRSAPSYYNIDISGSNVGSTLTSGISMQSGSTFKITNTGAFKFTNSNGFARASNSAISTTNNPTISLQTGSTVEFNASTGTQIVDARTDYSNLSITNAAIKTMNGDVKVDTLRFNNSKLSIGANTLTINKVVVGMSASNSLTGSNSSKLSITSNTTVGTVYFDQTTSADVAVTTGTNALQNLVLTGASGSATLGNKLNLFEKLSIKNSSTLNTGDYLVLRSIAGTSSNNTAYLDSCGGTISGQVTVEKYIHKAARGWRALTAPITYNGISQGYISSNWQSNFGLGNNYGTRITGPATGVGLDDVTIGSSLQTYNSTTGAWTKVTNTTTETQSGNAANAANKAFYIFIRGDRTVTPNSYNPNAFVTTTLASKGLLQTSTQTFTFTGVANKSWLVGNPYACTVDMSSITYNNIGQFVYVWDPNLAGSSTNTTGGYATFDRGDWTKPATVGSSTKYFQSGQAFFIKPTSATASIVFNENNKSTANQNNQVTGTVNNSTDIFNIKLLNIKTDGTKTEVDGVRAKYGANFSADVDEDDASKMVSSIENISLSRNGKSLVIEARPYITTTDTLFLNMTAMSEGANYEFSINPINFDASIANCKLVDNFLNTETPISLTSFTTIGFNVTNVAGSNAANRFYVVFKAIEALATNNILTVKAYKKERTVVVDFQVTNENNVKIYELEKSIDGNNFTKLSTIIAKNVNNTNAYSATDNKLVDINYYRIKSIQNNGNNAYSNVVVVDVKEKVATEIIFYPNPAHDFIIVNHPELNSDATLRIVNVAGETVITRQISKQNTSSYLSVSSLAKGFYLVSIITSEGETTEKMVVK